MSGVLVYKVALVVVLAVASGSTAGIAYYYQARATDLNTRVATLNGEANSLADQISTLTTQIENLTGQVKTLNSQVLSQTSKIESLRSQIQNLNSQLASESTSLQSLVNQVNLLQSQNSQLTSQLSQLQTKLAALGAQVAQLQAANSQLMAEISALQAQAGLCASGKTITIGELLDLSSVLSTQGVRAKDSSTLAISDINSFLSSAGCSLKFATAVDDYALDNALALTELQSLAASGVQVVIGPLNSGTTQYVLSFANSNHIVLISPSSTSVVLALPNDYLFRTAPNDRWQGKADARMLLDRGACAVIIVRRHDPYGDLLANATGANFKTLTTSSSCPAPNKGVVIDTIPYDTTTTDFTTVLSTLNGDFTSKVPSTYTAGQVALDFISFEEFGTMILKAKSSYASFPWSTLPWFGTDGEAQDSVIVNATYGGTVAQVKLPSTLYGYINNSKTLSLYSRFASSYGPNICDVYCLGAYDDVWLAALATLEAGSYNGTRIQAEMLTVAANYFGVTGPLLLDSNGDRIATTYQIWKVITVGTAQTWAFAGSWDASTDSIIWTSPP